MHQNTAIITPELTALSPCIQAATHTGSKKFTDENRAYNGLKNHQTVKHGDGEYVRGEVHINGMESFWALVRRGYDGTFHHIEPKHLHRYINEFVGGCA